ncbi:hypothetical protein [Halococcus thailandensis]|uniref:Ribbon-helix-helix protein CopG domain-containing protein n=1 Tax=Halococcus thailandensis JCM 13552 TaxID=1227457 RepID=M0MR46_9EURY|nr:hypothetical protein [Halococcus thailandensis]EMA48197.1 hypothetical protein C451_20737 [Halococcus thailandensis JCM 13552]
MSADRETQRVHFHSPEHLIERVDAIATLFQKDRTDVLNEALREYVDEIANDDSFQEIVANEYYENRLDFETVKQLVGADTAQRFRLLKRDLDSEPLDLSAPSDTDIYAGERHTVDPADSDVATRE